MRESGVRGLLVYCADYRCNYSIAISGDGWPDDVRLSDIEPRWPDLFRAACGLGLEDLVSSDRPYQGGRWLRSILSAPAIGRKQPSESSGQY